MYSCRVCGSGYELLSMLRMQLVMKVSAAAYLICRQHDCKAHSWRSIGDGQGVTGKGTQGCAPDDCNSGTLHTWLWQHVSQRGVLQLGFYWLFSNKRYSSSSCQCIIALATIALSDNECKSMQSIDKKFW